MGNVCSERNQTACQLSPTDLSDPFCASFNGLCQDAVVDMFPIPEISYSHDGGIRTSTAAYDFVEPDMIILYRSYLPDEDASRLDFGITDGDLSNRVGKEPKIIPYLYCAKTREEMRLSTEEDFQGILFWNDKIVIASYTGKYKEFTNLCDSSLKSRDVDLNSISNADHIFFNPFLISRSTFTRRLLETYEFYEGESFGPRDPSEVSTRKAFYDSRELKCFVPTRDCPSPRSNGCSLSANTFGFVHNPDDENLLIKYAGSDDTILFLPSITALAFQHATLECFCDTDYTCGSNLYLPVDDGTGHRSTNVFHSMHNVSGLISFTPGETRSANQYGPFFGPQVFFGTVAAGDLFSDFSFTDGYTLAFSHFVSGLPCYEQEKELECTSSGCYFSTLDSGLCTPLPLSKGTCRGTALKYVKGVDLCAERPQKTALKSSSSSSSSKRSGGTIIGVVIGVAVVVVLLFCLVCSSSQSAASSDYSKLSSRARNVI